MLVDIVSDHGLVVFFQHVNNFSSVSAFLKISKVENDIESIVKMNLLRLRVKRTRKEF
jgi:hypothetical protein